MSDVEPTEVPIKEGGQIDLIKQMTVSRVPLERVPTYSDTAIRFIGKPDEALAILKLLDQNISGDSLGVWIMGSEENRLLAQTWAEDNPDSTRLQELAEKGFIGIDTTQALPGKKEALLVRVDYNSESDRCFVSLGYHPQGAALTWAKERGTTSGQPSPSEAGGRTEVRLSISPDSSNIRPGQMVRNTAQALGKLTNNQELKDHLYQSLSLD